MSAMGNLRAAEGEQFPGDAFASADLAKNPPTFETLTQIAPSGHLQLDSRPATPQTNNYRRRVPVVPLPVSGRSRLGESSQAEDSPAEAGKRRLLPGWPSDADCSAACD